MSQPQTDVHAHHGLDPNPDPALNPAYEHTHPHLHHSAAAEKGRTDNVVYTHGTTSDPSIIPHASPLEGHLHNRKPSSHDNEKGGLDVSDAEKGSVSNDLEAEKEKPSKFSVYYAKYRWVVRKSPFSGAMWEDPPF